MACMKSIVILLLVSRAVKVLATAIMVERSSNYKRKLGHIRCLGM
jgi:hypothetical protein